MGDQRLKLSNTSTHVVRIWEHPDVVEQTVIGFPRWHWNYGIRAHHLDLFGEALMHAELEAEITAGCRER